MTLLAVVARRLHEEGTSFALIGAGAMAVHGVSRATADLDLLVTDARCLDQGYWGPVGESGVSIDIRRGDASDPLAGVVRLRRAAPAVLDVVVGRYAWQAAAVAAAAPSEVEGAVVPVVRRSDLILLKLYAGGPQDAWDVAQLLDSPEREATVAEVDRAIPGLPSEAQDLWRRVKSA